MLQLITEELLFAGTEPVKRVHRYLFSGYYMYIETSSPRVNGDNAILESPLLTFRGNMCLKFFYHMYGSTIGSLRVKISNQTVFTAVGEKGNKWIEAAITLSFIGKYKVK